MQQRAELGNRWWVVVGAVFGLVVGNGPVMQFTFGIFVNPVAQDLGIARGALSTALMTGLVATGLATPLAGRLMDRHGIRAVAVPAILLFSLAMVAIGLFAHSAWAFVVLYAAAGLVAAGQSPLGYAKAVTANFDAQRGLALGIAMAGVGLGTALMPKLASALTALHGWRVAYVGLGLVTLAVAMPAMLGLVCGRHSRPVPVGPQRAAMPGLSAAQAWRSAPFWKLALAFFAVATAASGVIAHIVPLMIDRGIAPATAASVMSSAGLAMIVGRVAAGWALDRMFAPYVASLFFAMPLAGIGLLLVASGPGMAVPATILVGLGLGAEVDLIAYLLSRYLGLRAFGEIYGYLFAVFMLGSGLGPFVMGMVYQHVDGYGPALQLLAGLLVLACAVILTLGRYRFGAGSGRASSPESPPPALVPH